MKITEVRNNLFGLEDLKGLISENRPGEWDWPGFFDQDPTRQDIHFNELMGLKSWLEKNGIKNLSSPAANSLLASLTPEQIEDIKNTVGPDVSPIRNYFGDDTFLDALRTPGNFKKMKAGKFDNKGNYSKFRNSSVQRKGTINGNQRKNYQVIKGKQANDNLAQPEDAQNSIDRPTSLNNVEQLRNMFEELGGSNIHVPDFKKREDVINYVDASDGLSKSVAETLQNKYGKEIRDFIINQYAPGTETDPFYFFLLFYYFNYCDRSASRGQRYLNNIRTPEVKEYTKYLLGEKPNIYDIVKTNINKTNDGFENILSTAGFDDDEYAVSRSWAYLSVYENTYGNILSGQFLLKLSQCFSLPETALFDPILNDITDTQITEGIKNWVEGKGNIALQELIKPQIAIDINDGCVAEKIFYAARALSGLLNDNYKKYGKIAETYNMSIDFLLTDGMTAINIWNKNANKDIIPKALVPLKNIYDGKKKAIATTEELVPFWRLLNFKNEFKDKTQGEIYYFLLSKTDPSIEWVYEYNRKKKIDNDLKGQSIDVLGYTKNNTYCFEYQGEQHYRPINVTYDDYAAFPFFTEMRDYILSECGFIQKTVGGTKFYIGPQTSDNDRMHEIRNIIIDAYKKFAGKISVKLSDTEFIKDRVDGNKLNETNFVATTNKWKTADDGKKERVKFENDTQMLAYFQSIIKRGVGDEEVFDSPEVGGIIPYLGSPKRFLDEVKTAQDMGRDIKKRDAIRNSRKKAGWVLSYIIPGKATEDEKKYTFELAGSEDLVFTWDNEGRNKLLGFLYNNNLSSKDQNETGNNLVDQSLFEQIIREILTNYGS